MATHTVGRAGVAHQRVELRGGEGERVAEATGEVAVAGKPLLPPTSLMGGATSWICVPPVAVAPAQLRIQTVSVSPQAAGDCNQQL
jgi:hypothetical protein